MIGCSNLKIDLDAANGLEGFHRPSNEFLTDSATAMIWRDCDRVKPTTMAVIPHHTCADDFSLIIRYEDLVINFELGFNHLRRFVVRRVVWKGIRPELNQSVSIVFNVFAYDHGTRCRRIERVRS